MNTEKTDATYLYAKSKEGQNLFFHNTSKKSRSHNNIFSYPSDNSLGDSISVPSETIEHVLSYCRLNERRVISAIIKKNIVITKNKFVSPTYTVKPVNYLSSSELCVVLAQSTHLLLEYFITYPTFRYRGYVDQSVMHDLRLNHRLYFTKMKIQIKEKQPDKPYYLKVQLINYKKINSVFFAKFQFNIGEKIFGSFFGVFSILQIKRGK